MLRPVARRGGYRRWTDKAPSGAVRRARRVWWRHEVSAAVTQRAEVVLGHRLALVGGVALPGRA